MSVGYCIITVTGGEGMDSIHRLVRESELPSRLNRESLENGILLIDRLLEQEETDENGF